MRAGRIGVTHRNQSGRDHLKDTLSRLTSSACRSTPVFWKTDFRWVRIVFWERPFADDICSTDLPSVIWLAVRASAGVRSNSACSHDGAGLALGTIDVTKTIDSAPVKPSSPPPHSGTTC